MTLLGHTYTDDTWTTHWYTVEVSTSRLPIFLWETDTVYPDKKTSRSRQHVFMSLREAIILEIRRGGRDTHSTSNLKEILEHPSSPQTYSSSITRRRPAIGRVKKASSNLGKTCVECFARVILTQGLPPHSSQVLLTSRDNIQQSGLQSRIVENLHRQRAQVKHTGI